MDFSVSSLAAGFLFGVLGLTLLREGKRNANPWHSFIGVALMVYPYFVAGPLLTWGIGTGLVGLAYSKR